MKNICFISVYIFSMALSACLPDKNLLVPDVKESLAQHLFEAANSRDMIHNPVNNTLYISNGAEVLHYDMANGALLDTISLGGELIGMDISPDHSQIAVADDVVTGGFVKIHLLDTKTHASSVLTIPSASGESGTYSIAYTDNNNLLSTSDYSGSGRVPFRYIDLTNETVSFENSINKRSMLSKNADHSLVTFSQSNNSSGPYGIYNPSTLSMALNASAGAFLYDIAIDRSSSFLAVPTYQSLRFYDVSGNLMDTFPAATYGAPLGVAYNPVKDLLYVPWAGTSLIGVFNALDHSFIENHSIPYTFTWHGNWGMNDGHIKISADGTQAFVQVSSGIYSFKL